MSLQSHSHQRYVCWSCCASIVEARAANHNRERFMTKTKGKKKDNRKQTTAKTTSNNLTTLRSGSRVRCTDDGVVGRITWANAVSVKIEWADGDKVTWRRDELASKQIEIIDADAETATAAEPNTEQSSVPATT